MVPPKVSHRSAMPKMEEIPYKNEEYGTVNLSFSFPDASDIYPTQNIPVDQEPTPQRTTAASDAIFVPAESVCSPVILNNKASTPTKTSSTSPTFPLAKEELSPVSLTQDDASRKESPGSPCDVIPDACEMQADISFGPSTSGNTEPAPFSDPDLQTISFDDASEPHPSHSSPSGTKCSQMASEETDRQVLKVYVRTPPYSPLLPSSFLTQTGTPPVTPDQSPLKATLVHIDTSPTDTPPETRVQRAETPNTEANQPSTCLDHSEPSESEGGTGDNDSPQDSGPLADSGNNQDSCRAGEKDEFHGGEDADKNNEGELDSDEEELLRILALCNPVFITFRK